MKSKVLGLVAVGLLAGPMAANAALIAYDVTGSDQPFGTGWTLTGQVVLDDADLVPFTNLVPNFVSWSFSWTNGIDTLSNDSVSDTFVSGLGLDIFEVDNSNSVFNVALCTKDCDAISDWPSIYVATNVWGASITPQGSCCVDTGYASWSGPRSVPEPGTLALLGLGLLGLGLTRRKAA